MLRGSLSIIYFNHLIRFSKNLLRNSSLKQLILLFLIEYKYAHRGFILYKSFYTRSLNRFRRNVKSLRKDGFLYLCLPVGLDGVCL